MPTTAQIIEQRKKEATKKKLFTSAIDIARAFGTKSAKKNDEEHFDYTEGTLNVHGRAYEENCWGTSYYMEVTVKDGDRTVFTAYGDDGMSYNHTVTGYAPGEWEKAFNAAAVRSKKPPALTPEQIATNKKWGI